MLDLFTNLLAQFGAFFQLQERLSSLSVSNSVAAAVFIFVMVIIAGNTVFTQFLELRKKFFGEWVHSAVAWVALVVACSVAALISAGVVINLRKAAAPAPILLVDTDTVIGRPLLLSWKYDSQRGTAGRYELQSSRNTRFDEIVRHVYRNGHTTLIGSVNSKLFWRVRAVDRANIPISGWSRPVQITQYDDSLKRILDTRSVNVYVSNSLNQGFFEFEADADGRFRGYDVAIIEHIVSQLPAHLSIDGPIALNFVAVDWKELLAVPKSGRADIIISAITALSEREDKLGLKFSQPYYCTTQSIIPRPTPMVSPVAKMIENKRVGVISKTTSEDLVQKFSGKFNVRLYDDGARMIADIARNEIDFGLTDTPFARAAELQYGTQLLNFKELVDGDFPEGVDPERREEKYAVAVRAGESKLTHAIDQIIEEMRKGKLGELLEKATEEFYGLRPSSPNTSIDRRKDPSDCRSGYL